jgi:hypothetical protein
VEWVECVVFTFFFFLFSGFFYIIIFDGEGREKKYIHFTHATIIRTILITRIQLRGKKEWKETEKKKKIIITNILRISTVLMYEDY